MGALFGTLLRQHREAAGVTGYRITKESGFHGPTLIAVEKGLRGPSPANLEALASVPELGLSLETLRAWAALDRLGEDLPLAKAWVEANGWPEC